MPRFTNRPRRVTALERMVLEIIVHSEDASPLSALEMDETLLVQQANGQETMLCVVGRESVIMPGGTVIETTLTLIPMAQQVEAKETHDAPGS